MGNSYCLFSANYLPNLGGVERYTYNLAKKLVEKGNRVIIVTSNTYCLKNHEIMEGIEVFRMPCYNVLKGRFPILKYNREFNLLYHKLLEISFDKIIVNTRFYIHSYFAVTLAKRGNIAPIVIEHGTNHFTVNNKLLDSLGHIYEHVITWLIKKKCNNFYGVSESCIAWLKHFGINADGVIYNAVDLDQIESLLSNPIVNYRKEFNINSSDIVITYTGRLVKEKGILKLINVLKTLNEKYNNIHLFIAGDGDLYDEIKKFNIKNMYVLGRINFEHIIALLKQTDIFCLPTDYPEGFPTSVLEAATCKCFIITTNSGGSKELIIDVNHGIIVEDNTIEELYSSIQYAIDDSEYRINATKLSYKRLINNFTWDIVVDKLMQIKIE